MRVWLEHPDTGGKQSFDAAAVEAWRLRGWVDCDPPEEPDLTKDVQPADVPSAPAPKPRTVRPAAAQATEGVAANG